MITSYWFTWKLYIAQGEFSVLESVWYFSCSFDKRQTDDNDEDGSGTSNTTEPTIPPGPTTTTIRLNGTNRHYFALVHWTGHPSDVLFIVTMTRRNNPSDSCLWRSVSSERGWGIRSTHVTSMPDHTINCMSDMALIVVDTQVCFQWRIRGYSF